MCASRHQFRAGSKEESDRIADWAEDVTKALTRLAKSPSAEGIKTAIGLLDGPLGVATTSDIIEYVGKLRATIATMVAQHPRVVLRALGLIEVYKEVCKTGKLSSGECEFVLDALRPLPLLHVDVRRAVMAEVLAKVKDLETADRLLQGADWAPSWDGRHPREFSAIHALWVRLQWFLVAKRAGSTRVTADCALIVLKQFLKIVPLNPWSDVYRRFAPDLYEVACDVHREIRELLSSVAAYVLARQPKQARDRIGRIEDTVRRRLVSSGNRALAATVGLEDADWDKLEAAMAVPRRPHERHACQLSEQCRRVGTWKDAAKLVELITRVPKAWRTIRNWYSTAKCPKPQYLCELVEEVERRVSRRR